MGLMDRFKRDSSTTSSQPESSPTEVTIDLAKSRVIDLKKKAGISLEKAGASNVRAAVYLVLDHSGSMRHFYKDGTVQDFTERILGVSAALDDDGIVPVVLFDSGAHEPVDVSVDNFTGVIERILAKSGHMGTTNYAAAMEKIIQLHKGSSEPALVIFQTDGSPDSRKKAEVALCESADLPIFWQFVGFGNDSFDFLKKLDDLAVPAKRVIDNAGFFAAGSNPKAMSDERLYNEILKEFPQWLRQARSQGIV